MNTELIELAQRAVACDGWRWLYGCPAKATFHGEEIHLISLGHNEGSYTADFYCLEHGEVWEGIHVDEQEEMGILPDFNEPATLGCLLHLVREAMQCHIHVSLGPDGYDVIADIEQGVCTACKCVIYGHPTEAHALVAALEAAP